MDEDSTWRVVYRIDDDAIAIAEVFKKKTQATPGGCYMAGLEVY